MLDADGAERLAARVLETRYPGADAAFATGSILRGEATAFSDLDLVVLFARLPNARREAFHVGGLPVDVFLHDGETLAHVFDGDLAAGKPAHLTMIAEARVVGPKPAEALAWRERARTMLRAGPPPMDFLRLLITDRIDDLRAPQGRATAVATATWLYPVLAELILRTRGAWAATAKWIPKQLRAVDPGTEAAFSGAFEAFFSRDDSAPLIDFAERALAPLGGFLFDGWTRELPPRRPVASALARTTEPLAPASGVR